MKTFTASSQNDLELVLQDIITRWNIPGLAIGIVQGESIVYAKGFGVQSLDTQAPVTLDSVFCIQSISKCFVATAVMQWVERGKLALDAPLVHYLPYFCMDDERSRQITIRQALSHTSGMPDLDENEYLKWMAHPEYDDESLERFVRSLSDRKLIASPGERFSYSNIAYDVLGDLLAKVSAQSFECLMQENILTPSGMLNSTYKLAAVPSQLLVTPHLRSPEMKPNPIYPYHRADAPSSFLFTTVIDMCHWGVACLNRGNYLGRSILSPAGFDQMWSPVVKRGEPPRMYEQMGLGWNLGQYKGVKTISHGGGGFGSTAFLLILPEKKIAVFILCNEESPAHFHATRAVVDTLLGQKPQVGAVSWMAPISRALAAGGIAAAYACYAELKASGTEEYDFDEYDLYSLAIQLASARQPDLALAVLGLNIQVYPESIASHLGQAELYLQKGDLAQSKASARKVLSLDPANLAAAGLLEKV